MSLWDKEVAIQSKRFKKLPQPKLLTFMVACIDHAFVVNYASFSTAIEPRKLRFARVTLDQLWLYVHHPDSPFNFEATLEGLYSIMPGEDDPEGLIPGWDYTIAAFTSIIRGVMADNFLKEVMNAADAAYQSICEQELNRVMLQTGKGLCGEEITEAERASPVCREESAFQLQCLKAIENDIPVARSNIEE